MELEVQIEATPNEWRRLFGGPDITPLVELMSDLLDDAAMVVVEHRLAALDAEAEKQAADDALPARQTTRPSPAAEAGAGS